MRNHKFIAFVSFLLSLCMGFGGISVFALPTGAVEIDEVTNIPHFFDNFDSYSTGTNELVNGVEMGGGWVAKRIESEVWNNDNPPYLMRFTYGFENGALKLSTNNVTSTGKVSSVISKGPKAIHKLDPGIGENQVISFDTAKSHDVDAWGVQFLSHNNGKSGYIFMTSGMYTYTLNSGNLFYGLYKYDNESLTVLYEAHRTAGKNQAGGYAGKDGTSHIEISYLDGTISWNYSHSVGSNTAFAVSGEYTDEYPFDLEGEELSAEIFTSGSDTATRYVNFDNFRIIQTVPYLTIPEPADVLYIDLFNNAGVDSDNIVDLGSKYVIRKIQSAERNGQIFTLYCSNDKINWVKVSDCNFDEYGNWLNNKFASEYRYIAFSFNEIPEDIKILTDVDSDKKYNTILGQELHLYSVFDNVEDNASCVWSSNSDSAFIENGVLSPKRRGEAVVSATYGDKVLTVNLVILSDFDMALSNDSITEYIVSKKPIVDEINRGITEKNAEIIELVLTNNGIYNISDINDIESSKITELSSDKLDSYINRLMTYAPFAFSNETEINNFFNVIEAEYYVGLVCNVNDYIELKNILHERNGYFNLLLDNSYYVKYEDSIVGKLVNSEYKNLIDLQKKFNEQLVMTTFDNALSLEMMQAFVEDFSGLLEYNTTNYEKIKENGLFESLLKNKKQLTSLDSIVEHIDNFKIPNKNDATTENSKPSTNNGGGGGGRGGGGRHSVSFAVGTDLVKEIKTPVEPLNETNLNTTIFSDLNKEHWAYDSILSLYKKGILSGNSDGSFEPEREVTRAEFIKMLITLDDEVVENNNDFSDISVNDWYYPYFVKAINDGIIFGDDNGNMNPKKNITREEMAVIIFRLLKKQGVTGDASDSEIRYVDQSSISDWAIDAVCVLTENNIFNGSDTNMFNPLSNATRAEACAVISRLN